MTRGIHGEPTCKRALIVCPSSLVMNWGKEIIKWLGGRIKPDVVEDTRAHKVKEILRDFGANYGVQKNEAQVAGG